MDSRFNSPAEIASLVSKSGVTKSMLSLPKMILLGLMAGAFIAFGGAASDVAMHGVADVGLARVVAGAQNARAALQGRKHRRASAPPVVQSGLLRRALAHISAGQWQLAPRRRARCGS